MDIVDRRVPLDQIGKVVGPSPVPRFRANVRRHGVIVPVLLREVVGPDGELGYHIIDGNRRVAAARSVRMIDVPARVFLGITDDEAARITLLCNNFRSDNDITEFWAIKHLERSGHSKRRVAVDAGVTMKSLELRNRWSTLDRRIFVGYATGRISASVAKRVARLPQEDQRALGDLFEERGRLQTDDVTALQSSRLIDPHGPVLENEVPLARPSSGAGVSYQSAGDGLLRAPRGDSVSSDPASSTLVGPEQRVSLMMSSPISSTAQSQPEQHEIAPADLSAVAPLSYPAKAKLTTTSDRRISVETSLAASTTILQSSDGVRQLPEDIQRGIEHVARLGCGSGIQVEELVAALRIAYQHLGFVAKVTGEATRG